MLDDQQNEEEKPIIEDLDFNRADYTFIPKGVHEYIQQGYYLVCKSCDLSHAVYIGKDRVMVGEKDGVPIIKERKEIGMA